MNEKTRTVVEELKAEMAPIYGQRLRGLYLYGSYARGDQDAESDVDVLLVLDRVGDYGQEIDRTSHLVSALSLKHGVSISRVFVSERDWRDGDTPFLANVREDAVAA